MDFSIVPAFVWVALLGAALGFLGSGILGAAILGGAANVILGWTSIIYPTTPTLDPWSWLFTIMNVPTVDMVGAMYLVATGCVVGGIGAYIGKFLGGKEGSL